MRKPTRRVFASSLRHACQIYNEKVAQGTAHNFEYELPEKGSEVREPAPYQPSIAELYGKIEPMTSLDW